ncbi:MAG: hypothetical protein QM755_08325 [Luteolibacter sp.]
MNPHRDPKYAAEKRLRALELESRHLWRLKRDTPLVPLANPYPRGWIRWLDWTPEALRRSDISKLHEVLPLIQNREWSRWGDFTRYDRILRKRVDPGHSPRKFSLKEFKRLHVRQGLRGFFETHRRIPLNTPGYFVELKKISWGGFIRFCHPEYLISKKAPYMMTHQVVVLPEVESRLSEIEQIIERHGGHRKILRIFGERDWYRVPFDRYKRLTRIHLKEMREAKEQWFMEEGAAQSAPFSLPASRPGRILAPWTTCLPNRNLRSRKPFRSRSCCGVSRTSSRSRSASCGSRARFPISRNKRAAIGISR